MVILAFGASFGRKYVIRVDGHLGPNRGKWFDGLAVTPTDGGQTLISGFLADQSALHAVLTKIRDLGVELASVHRMGDEDEMENRDGEMS